MKPVVPKPQRCAIYTRKSTEHNLDLEFNSLDAQREACEAYIKSQEHEGWRLVPDCYDDGGLSGASLDRPALQQLLADVRAGKITIVVVYKVDRLTRSLADFAKLVELFDEHGVSFVSITQSFNTKQGARYLYYVSHALLQNRKAEAGSIARVPAPEIESLVCDGLRRHLGSMAVAGPPTALADRDLIERHVARVMVTPQALEVRLNPAGEESAQAEDPNVLDPAPCRPPIMITLPWIAPSFMAIKGILHAPSSPPAMSPERRDALLTAIAKARRWIEGIRLGRFASFAEIAEHEAQGERHIRLLAPLALLSPRIIAAIVDGTAPADLTVTDLAKAMPYSWAEQERRIGLSL